MLLGNVYMCIATRGEQFERERQKYAETHPKYKTEILAA
jgi:hypothetical protein